MMTLPIHCIPSKHPERPWLIWIHGLLGSSSDWQTLLPYFADWPCATVDLPGHGDAAALRVSGFTEMDQALNLTLSQNGIRHYWLIGYSLGARVAMYHASVGWHKGLCGLIAIGGNPGLQDKAQRLGRLDHDAKWAERFRQQPIEQVLGEWYQQTVFAGLDKEQRAMLIKERSHIDPEGVAAMLEATSLGNQPWLGAGIEELDIPFSYICGEHDEKFQQIAQQQLWPLITIHGAGHNIHRTHPTEFIDRLLKVLTHFL